MRSSSFNFESRVNAYAQWRQQVSQALRRYEQWLGEHGLGDPSLKSRLEQIQRRLKEERMSVAFVAEFSRGKSELINALFFSGYGRRILPSSAGRTTMCPTELMYDRGRKPSIRLLPIETRLRDVSLADLREDEAGWTEIGLEPQDVDSVAAAFDAVRETRSVPVAEATALGLYDPEDPDQPVRPDAQGLVDIPRWRHAIVNIPDPLLEQGLVVIDTPGLNAIGNEPELTLNLIPSADAVLFVLAADAGVTRSDIEVWRENISATHRSGRYVVLNKIDGLWDDLRAPEQIDREIRQQVESVARTLALPDEQIYPVSAQKGLAAKIHQDAALLARSRLPALEHALSTDLVPRQRAVVREHVERAFNELHSVAHSVLQSRRRNNVEQLFELNSLRGKNRNVVDVMAARIKGERADFEKGLRQLQALRAVFVRHSQAAYATVSIDNLRRHTQTAREVMRTSNFSLGLREGMRSLLAAARADFEGLGRRSDESAR
ncbi:MAG: dynamin family protein [Burkholderiaceae bacterium]